MHSFFHFSKSSWKHVFLLISCTLVGFFGGIGGGVLNQRLQGEEQITPIQQLPVILDTHYRDSSQDNPFISLKKVENSIFEIFALPQEEKKQQDLSALQFQFRGYALVLTSDGWLVTSANTESVNGELKILDSEKNQYQIEKQIQDKSLGIIFLKINASNLRAFQFSSWSDTANGTTGFLFDDHKSVSSLIVSPLGYATPHSFQDAIQSTASLRKVFNPEIAYSQTASPFVNKRGELIGLASREKGIIPSFYFKDSFSNLLKYGALKRPTLQLMYVDRTVLPYIPMLLKNSKENAGAIVIGLDKKGNGTLQHGSVPPPFLSDDVITSINEDILDSNRSLSEVLQQYKQGDSVSFKIIRAGKEMTEKVLLP